MPEAMQAETGFRDWPRAISNGVLSVEMTRDRTEVEISVEYEERSDTGGSWQETATGTISLADWDNVVEHIRSERLIPPPGPEPFSGEAGGDDA